MFSVVHSSEEVMGTAQLYSAIGQPGSGSK